MFKLNGSGEPTFYVLTDGSIIEGTLSVGELLSSNSLHVGGTSDPGTDNLIVDGTSTLTGNVGIGNIPTSTYGLRVLSGTVGGVYVNSTAQYGVYAIGNSYGVRGSSNVGWALYGDGKAYISDYLRANGGIHVGGASDPGTYNLIVDGASTLTGNVGIGLSPTVHKLDVLGDINLSGNLYIDTLKVIDDGAGWHRCYGSTGFVNMTWDGGWVMNDSTWIKSYNNKGIYTGGRTSSGSLHVGGQSDPGIDNLIVDGASTLTGNVGIGLSPTVHKLDVLGDINLTGNLLHQSPAFLPLALSPTPPPLTADNIFPQLSPAAQSNFVTIEILGVADVNQELDTAVNINSYVATFVGTSPLPDGFSFDFTICFKQGGGGGNYSLEVTDSNTELVHGGISSTIVFAAGESITFRWRAIPGGGPPFGQLFRLSPGNQIPIIYLYAEMLGVADNAIGQLSKSSNNANSNPSGVPITWSQNAASGLVDGNCTGYIIPEDNMYVTGITLKFSGAAVSANTVGPDPRVLIVFYLQTQTSRTQIGVFNIRDGIVPSAIGIDNIPITTAAGFQTLTKTWPLGMPHGVFNKGDILGWEFRNNANPSPSDPEEIINCISRLVTVVKMSPL